jgi:hypothetical protein
VPRSSATAILAAYRHGLKLTTASSWLAPTDAIIVRETPEEILKAAKD